MLIFLTALFLIILILSNEFGHFLAAKISGVRVDEFGVGFPPRLLSKKIGETEYSLNLLPLGGFVKIHGENASEQDLIEDFKRSLRSQTFPKKFFIIAAGVITNILVGWFAFSLVLGLGLPQKILVETTLAGSPADLAGIKPGEIIEEYSSVDTFLKYVDANRGQEIIINGKAVVPRIENPVGEGPLGITIVSSGIGSTPFPQNIWSGLKATFVTLGLIFSALGSFLVSILTGDLSAMGQVTGPVGVFGIIRDTSQLGYVYLVQLLGLISLNLAALNIIPFPALDGGRLLFIFLQRLFGERVLNRRLEAAVNTIGFLFLIALMMAVTVRDIMSLG